MRAISTIIVAAVALAGANAQSSNVSVAPIAGGTFEASGAVAVGNGVLFVDDGSPEEVFWMALGPDRRQSGSAERIPIGVALHDMEGITTDGTYVYVVASQSKRPSQRGAGLARFTFDPATKRIADVQTISDLRGIIVGALPAVAAAAGHKVDGLDIEGLAWDRGRQRLLLGLRAPTQGEQALIVPLHLKDASGRFTRDNVVVAPQGVIQLPLGGGIRSLEFDPAIDAFTILSAPERGGAFSLWRWSGAGAPEREPLAAQVADAATKPEGITRVRVGKASYRLIVFDTSRYAALD